MSRIIHNILKGIGNIIDFSTPAYYTRFVPKKDYDVSKQYGSNRKDALNLYNDCVKVGGYLRNAMSVVVNEMEKKDETKKS